MRISERDRNAVVAGLIFATVGVGFYLDSVGAWQIQLVYFWPLTLIAVGISQILGKADRGRRERDRSAKLIVAEERVRIARELHDIVAHSVSLMTVQIAAARRVFDKKPQEAQAALAAAEETGRQSLSELRSIIGVLRSADASIEAARPKPEETQGAWPSFVSSTAEVAASEAEESVATEPLPGIDQIGSLIDTLRTAGMDVTLHVTGPRPRTTPGVELALYRVIQEALTNVMRHAGEATVAVRLTSNDSNIDVEVIDNGEGSSGGTP
ncbi:MAG TPA: histidine kinase, partial [Actinomycetota bacterium]|nr:histidine kinase [Actinomycetota bacterium]